jgi:site-specific recombinase XerD
MEKVIRPAAERAGLQKVIGRHTFRHSYSTLPVANGDNVKLVQELMRHASSRFTLISTPKRGPQRKSGQGEEQREPRPEPVSH